MIVIDSAAALVPRLEAEAGIGGSVPGLQSRVFGHELQKLRAIVRRGAACVLFLNQVRNRASGEGETSAGGPPLKLFAAIRLVLLPVAGSRVRLRALKYKAAAGAAHGEIERRKDLGFVESP